MQQIFNKSINGISLQFNRLLYPVRYQVKKDGFDADGTIHEVVKREDGAWKTDKETPIWLKEIFDRVCEEIKLNEEH